MTSATVSAPAPAAPRFLASRLSLFYGAMCIPIGVSLPFFPVWLEYRGFTPEAIAGALALGAVMRVIAGPAFAFLADRTGNPRLVVLGLASASTLGFACFPVVGGIWALTLVSALVTSLYLAIIPLTEAVTLRETQAHRMDYGRVRLWGSITFIAATLGAGSLVGIWGAPVIIWLLAVSVGLVALLALTMPTARPGPSPRAPRVALLPGALALLRDARFVLFIASAAFVQSAHAVYYGFGTLGWQRQGHGEAVIGALWATGVVAEIMLFLFSMRVVARLGPERLLALAGLAAVVRWGLTSLEPPLVLLFPLQALHALTFGAAHIGAMHYILNRVPPALAATAQGFYAAAVAGLGMSLATAAAGPLFAAHGSGAYLFAAAVGLLGGLGGVLMMRTGAVSRRATEIRA